MSKVFASGHETKIQREAESVAVLLERCFDTAIAAPGGIKKLREMILTLAMRGKLMPQDPNDPPVSELLKEIEAEKKRLVKEGKIKTAKPLPEIEPEEMPYELPQGWVWVRLDCLVSKIGSGSTPRGGKSSYIDNGIPFLRSQNIWNDGIRLDDVAFISQNTHKKMSATEVFPNDILLNITGASLGRCALVPENWRTANVSQHVTIIRCIKKELNRFIHNLLLSPYCQRLIWSRQVGMAREGLSKKVLESFEIPIPPLPEQHRIVAKIDQLMTRCDELEKLRTEREQMRLAVHTSAIRQLLAVSAEKQNDQATEKQDNNTRTCLTAGQAAQFIARHFGELYIVKENAVELRKAILQLAVMGKLVPQDPNDPPASELLKELEIERQRLITKGNSKKLKHTLKISIDEIPFQIPEEWQWVRLANISESIDYGTSQKTCADSSLVPVYRMGNIVDGQLVDNGLKYIPQNIDDLPHLYLKSNDILFNRTNSYELVGKSAIYSGPDNYATFASYLIRVRLLKNRLLPVFFRIAMNAPYFRATQIEPEIVQQCGQANFNGSKLSLCLVPLPPLPEQHRIVAKVDQLMSLCDALEKQINAAATKQTELLDALMAQI